MRPQFSTFRSYISKARADPRGTASAVRDSVRTTHSGRASPAPGTPTGGATPVPDASRQSWGQWAGQKLRAITGGSGEEGGRSNVEKVFVFPGWASRHYHDDPGGGHPSGGVYTSDAEKEWLLTRVAW